MKIAAMDSDQQIKDQFLDWLPVLSIALPRVPKNIFTIDDINNLRLTCKLTKQLVAPRITKLKLHLDVAEFPQPDYENLVTSPLLDHILDLCVFSEDALRVDDTRFSPTFFSLVHHLEILLIKMCSPLGGVQNKNTGRRCGVACRFVE
jgi:hypothetical protein